MFDFFIINSNLGLIPMSSHLLLKLFTGGTVLTILITLSETTTKKETILISNRNQDCD